MARPKNFDYNPQGSPAFGMRNPETRPPAPKPRPDFGYDFSTSLDRFLRMEREAYPRRRMTSAYRTLIGDNPKLAAGDMRKAAVRLYAVERAIDRGHWTPNEWGRLHRMERRWRARMLGQDPRYLLVGNRPGRVNREQQQYLDFRRRVANVLKLHEKSQEKSEA